MMEAFWIILALIIGANVGFLMAAVLAAGADK